MLSRRLLAVLSLALIAVSCGSAEPEVTATTRAESEPSFLGDPASPDAGSPGSVKAEDLIPWAAPPSDLSGVPSEMYSVFMNCLESQVDAAIVPAGSAPFEQDVAASNCAVEAGFDEFGQVWRPDTPEQQESNNREVLNELAECLEEAGYVDLPYGPSQYSDEPLFDVFRFLEEDPSAQGAIDECILHEEGSG